MRVLILGARAPAALEWGRIFQRSGWQVNMADSVCYPVSRFSRCCRSYTRLPAPAQHYRQWRDALRETVRRKRIDVVLPTCEEIFYLACAGKDIPCRVISAALPLLHRLHHKALFAAMSENWTISTPPTTLLSTRGQLALFLNHSGRWVFKPAYSRFADNILICPSSAQAAAITPTQEAPWLAQRYIAGQEYCSYSILSAGRVCAHVCYRPRYRVGHGAGIWFDPVDPSPIRRFIAEFGANTGYSGQVGFDFIADADGRYYVLECNPRATSGIHFFAGQSAALLAALLEGQGRVCPDNTPLQLKSAMLLCAARQYGGRTAFWRDYRQARDVLHVPAERNLYPAQIVSIAEMFCRALMRRCNLLAATTADIAWNGQTPD